MQTVAGIQNIFDRMRSIELDMRKRSQQALGGAIIPFLAAAPDGPPPPNKSPQPEKSRDFEALLRQATPPAQAPAAQPANAAPGDMDQLIFDAARREKIPAPLLKAVVKTESGFNPRAVSSAGAMGLTQLMPGTAKMLGVNDPFNPAQNLRGGARHLRDLLTQFGDLDRSLAAYNAGAGNVRKFGGIPPFPETRAYVATVKKHFQNYAAQF